MHIHRQAETRSFAGHGTRFYSFLAGVVLRRMYRRIALDNAGSPGTALDVGTGPGILVAELARRTGLAVTGVDTSTDMVKRAAHNVRHHPRASVQVGDAANLPFADDSFDLVVSSLSLHHWDDPAAAAAELARVLRPGGTLRIYDVHSAKLDEFLAADRFVLSGQTPFPTGIPFFWKLTRLTLHA
jgi:ubiquinone/menaquinone biosynthesis C-methylase UbiE